MRYRPNSDGTDHDSPTSGGGNAGDPSSITADPGGIDTVVVTGEMATLDFGPASVFDRAFVVHAGADDFTLQPSGAAQGAAPLVN